eukprot:929116_1
MGSKDPTAGTCRDNGRGDPVVNWDEDTERWFLSQFAVGTSSQSLDTQCVFVSETSNPCGSYFTYKHTYSSSIDFPKASLNPTSYFITQRENGMSITAWDKQKLVAGPSYTATSVYHNLGYCSGDCVNGLMPFDWDG